MLTDDDDFQKCRLVDLHERHHCDWWEEGGREALLRLDYRQYR